MNKDRIILPIKPVPFLHFRTGNSNSDARLFHIPEVCQSRHRITGKEKDIGKPCDEYLEGNIYCGHINEKGNRVKHTLSEPGRERKRLIERYNKYRLNLFHMAKEMDWSLQSTGMAIYYHLPIPVRWPKAKRKIMHGQCKGSKPDLDNYNKALFDALTGKDELIGQRSGDGKFWFDPEKVDEELRDGYIEILLNQPVYNPYNVTLSEGQEIEMQDIETRREKARVRKAEIEEERKKALPKRTPKPLKILDQKKLFKKEDKIK